MKNFITPSSHPSSFLTGSTLESMVEKAKDLGTGYYVCTDNGYLTDTLKAYNYANKKGLRPILGCELYVVLDNLKLNEKRTSEKIKYFTITIHAKNQKAYQFLIKKISDKKRRTIKILDHDYPVFDWADVCDFAEEDFTAVIGGPQCIVCKNLLTEDEDFAKAMFLELKNKFKDNFYSSVIPMEFDKKWVTSSSFTFTNGQSVTLNSSILAETEQAVNFRVSLENVANKPDLHKTIRRIYVNGIGYNVNKKIISAQNYKEFKSINRDIFELYNLFITEMSKKHNVKVLINDYSYFAHKDDQLVQNLKLGEEIRLSTNNSMKSSEEVVPYLSKHYSSDEIENFIQNSYEWASNFNEFKLKYEYRLVKESNNSLQSAMNLIKKIGRFDINNIEHRKRLKYEIDVIHSNGVVDLLPYFFPISKALNYYADKGRVVGPARGSAGGSFLMYCMGITQINPLKYGLYFSRFLTLGRIQKGTLPDVDCFAKDTEILTENGYISIENLIKISPALYPKLLSFDGKNYIWQSPVLIFKKEEKKKVYEFELDNGKTIKCTQDHLVLTEKGWMEIYKAYEEGLEIKSY